MGLSEFFIKQAILNWIKKLRKDKKMEKFLKAIEGKKTYITMGVIAILGAVGALNQAGVTNIQIPDMVFTILAALGVYTRSVSKK